VLMMIGLVIPAIRTTLLAFKDSFGENWVGFENFSWMFTSSDTLTVLRNTAIWVLLTPFLATAIGLIYSILVDGSRFESVYKALVFMPMAISMVGASLIWRFVYDYKEEAKNQIGLFNQILIWIQAGFAMVVLSAAIKNIPSDMVEAAQMDGANPFQMFFRITLPSIRPAVLVVYITILIGTLKVFDIVRTMTGGNFDTSVIANEMYNQSFRYDESGKGAALAVFLFVLVLPVVVYQIRQVRRERLESR
jgi:alpha-glucoside transport system permease protein